MLLVFQMQMLFYTDGKSNFKVHILCRKLQLTSKIRMFSRLVVVSMLVWIVNSTIWLKIEDSKLTKQLDTKSSLHNSQEGTAHLFFSIKKSFLHNIVFVDWMLLVLLKELIKLIFPCCKTLHPCSLGSDGFSRFFLF